MEQQQIEPSNKTLIKKPYLHKHICTHCNEVLVTKVHFVGEAMSDAELIIFGKAVFSDKIVHAMLDCKVLKNIEIKGMK